jgi:hypothetical protein
MIHAEDVGPHERRRDNGHDRNSDDPETGKTIYTTTEMNVRSKTHTRCQNGHDV